MKVLYIDTFFSGHHEKYFRSLIKNKNAYESIAIMPNDAPKDKVIKYHLDSNFTRFSIIKYAKWMSKVKQIINIEKPNVVHFLYGDFFYRYFGLFLSTLNVDRIIVTLHHVKKSFLRNYSIRKIAKKVSVLVVHTKSLYDDLLTLKINNIVHIEYPSFIPENKKGHLLKGLKNKNCIDGKIMLALGATRKDKGLDILLQALKKIDKNFYLVIAGKEADFSEKYIRKETEKFSGKIFIYLEYLTEEELIGLYNYGDIIVLPYRKFFDGASGPLAEGVSYGKIILGPNHGSLGKIINDNDLGMVFNVNDINSLCNSIIKLLDSNFSKSDKYIKYQESILEKHFVEKYNKLYSQRKEK